MKKDKIIKKEFDGVNTITYYESGMVTTTLLHRVDEAIEENNKKPVVYEVEQEFMDYLKEKGYVDEK